MTSFRKIAPLLLLTTSFTACVTESKAHFSMSQLDAKQQIDFAQAKIILLGEQHDNPDHHVIQQEILEKLGHEGRLKAVVFEQVDWTEQGLLSQLKPANLGKLREKIEWDKSGWPPYDLYEPLFATAVKYKAVVIAGGLPKNRLDLLYKHGYQGAFTAPEIERLHLRKPMSAEALTLVGKEISDGHCHMIPNEEATKMVPIQRARDAAMIRGYQNEAPRDGVTVFILGAGHARKEFGVPSLLELVAPNARVWSVGMMEEGAKAPPVGAYDKVFITDAFERPDPCEAMKKHMDEKAVGKGNKKVPEDKDKKELAPTDTQPSDGTPGPGDAPATPPEDETPLKEDGPAADGE
ncbi:MAG: ChaN family lipoprotein [Chitinophagaceae bacterium]|nr:ChaN family lipoprotein [Oligoflexus sp.]